MSIPSQAQADILEQYVIHALLTNTALSLEHHARCATIVESGRFAPWCELFLHGLTSDTPHHYLSDYLRRPELLLHYAWMSSDGAMRETILDLLVNTSEATKNLLGGGYYEEFNRLWREGGPLVKERARVDIPTHALRYVDTDIIPILLHTNHSLLMQWIHEHYYPEILWDDIFMAYRVGATVLVEALCHQGDDDVKRNKLGVVAALTCRIEEHACVYLDKDGIFTHAMTQLLQKKEKEIEPIHALYEAIAAYYGYHHMHGAIQRIKMTLALGERVDLEDPSWFHTVSSLEEIQLSL